MYTKTFIFDVINCCPALIFNNLKVFRLNFDTFNGSLLNKSIILFQNILLTPWYIYIYIYIHVHLYFTYRRGRESQCPYVLNASQNKTIGWWEQRIWGGGGVIWVIARGGTYAASPWPYAHIWNSLNSWPESSATAENRPPQPNLSSYMRRFPDP